MIEQLAIGSLLIFVSVVIQAAFISGVIYAVDNSRRWIKSPPHSIHAAFFLGAATLWLMAAHSASIWLWAIAFVLLGEFQDIETSVYFSSVAFTTLGFGDIVLPVEWRQLAGFCAANGLLVFGMSAAVLVEVFREIRVMRRGGKG